MIKVKFYKTGNLINGFEISGHGTENENDLSGKLVCASVSSAAYMAANTVSEIIGDSTEATVNDGYMKIICQNGSECTQKVFEGLLLHITELEKQYSKRIQIITEV